MTINLDAGFICLILKFQEFFTPINRIFWIFAAIMYKNLSLSPPLFCNIPTPVPPI